MRTEIETIQRTWYISTADPTIRTTYARYKDTIELVDKIPAIYEIVRGTKSKAWGRTSNTYIACGCGDSPENVLYRAQLMWNYANLGRASELHGVPVSDFFGWRARFTIEHYRDPGFRGGFFQQFDGTYDRGCTVIDYTPATLDLVIERFLLWCNSSYKFPTAALKIDKKIVRRYEPPR
jgi:hypothetical protein